MTTEELYDLMEDGNLGYACVYKQGDQGMHTDYMFKMWSSVKKKDKLNIDFFNP